SKGLERAAEELAVQRRDQSEREALLQARLDEVGHTEGAFNEREAELRRRSDELDERSEVLARQSEEVQQQLLEIDQQRQDAEAAAQAEAEEHVRSELEQSQLSEQLRSLEAELTVLRTQLADQEAAQGERE